MSTAILDYTLASPITVGDLSNQIVIDKLELLSVSITNGAATPTLSLVLIHRASGYQVNVVYTDASVLTFWNSINAGNSIEQAAFQKLMTDGKLPTGTF